jgi:hypothetical protein
MKTLELNKMGLAPMEQSEMLNIEGGGIKEWCWNVLKTWGAEKVLDSTYEFLKKNCASNPYSGVPDCAKGFIPVRM